jgi:hypothetical protein
MEGSNCSKSRAGGSHSGHRRVPVCPPAVQGWFLGKAAASFLRIGLAAAALLMIEGGLWTDIAGVSLAALVFAVQRLVNPKPGGGIPVRGAD